MLIRMAGVFAKLALSVMVIIAFLAITARVPFFNTNEPLSVASFRPVTGAGVTAGSSMDSRITFAGADDSFSGSFYALGEDSGFELEELEVTGPCENAGRRYLAENCPDCVVTDALTEPGQPKTLFWSDARNNGDMGTIFLDCVRELGNSLVSVPKLSFNEQIIRLDGTNGDTAETAAIPRIARSERVSHMTLGNWNIVVDSVEHGRDAVSSMGSLLVDSGWQRMSEGERDNRAIEQRVYARNADEGSTLCVLTLHRSDEGYQLVTMMN